MFINCNCMNFIEFGTTILCELWHEQTLHSRGHRSRIVVAVEPLTDGKMNL